MTFALKKSNLPKYTVSDYEQWEGRWELIAGIPFAMSPLPNAKHQWINSNIIYELKSALKECNSCRVYMPIDWKINEDTVVQPDASVVCGEITGHYLRFPPKVAFEIVSQASEKKDREIKHDLYYASEVKYYVIVLPEHETIEVYEWSENGYILKLQGHSGQYDFDLDICKMTIDFQNIWS